MLILGVSEIDLEPLLRLSSGRTFHKKPRRAGNEWLETGPSHPENNFDHSNGAERDETTCNFPPCKTECKDCRGYLLYDERCLDLLSIIPDASDSQLIHCSLLNSSCVGLSLL